MQQVSSNPYIKVRNPLTGRKASLVLNSGNPVLNRLDDFVACLKTAWKIDEDTSIRIRTCLEEAVFNAIIHGNKQQPGKYVHILCSLGENGYTFAIQDEGPGFDFRSVAERSRNEVLSLKEGRGIFIIRLMSDTMNFLMNGNYLKLFFHNKNAPNSTMIH